MSRILELYTKDGCIFCDKALVLYYKYLKEYDFILEIHDVETPEDKRVLEERVGGSVKTVPQVFIDGEYVGGYDQLYLWIVEFSLTFTDDF